MLPQLQDSLSRLCSLYCNNTLSIYTKSKVSMVGIKHIWCPQRKYNDLDSIIQYLDRKWGGNSDY